MSARKYIRSMQHRTRPSGYRPRAHSPRPLRGKPRDQQGVRVKYPSPDRALLRHAVMLLLRLEVIHRTAQQIQSAPMLSPRGRYADLVGQLRDGVCNPIADQTRLARLLLRCLSGGEVLDVSVVNRRSARIS